MTQIVKRAADVVVIGAGLSGVAAAHFLSARHGADKVIIVDPRSPVSTTSSVSTECYRDFWPTHGPMRALVGRSIDLMEKLALDTLNEFHFTRRGYVYLSQKPPAELLKHFEFDPAATELRLHNAQTGLSNYTPNAPDGDLTNMLSTPRGIDLIEGNDLIKKLHPYVSPDIRTLVHARRCGWVSAQTMGMVQLELAKSNGVEYLQGDAAQLHVDDRGAVTGVAVRCGDRMEEIACPAVVNAAGPWIGHVHKVLVPDAPELPVQNEVHGKVILKDVLNVLPRDVPMVIYSDAQRLDWTDEEREMLADVEPDVTGMLSGGVHFRPYGPDSLLLLWEFFHHDMKVKDRCPPYDIQFRTETYPEICVKGLARAVPGFAQYEGNIPRSTFVDGGYYCKTPENLPLVGPYSCHAVQSGYYVCGATSGYGVMVAQSVGELVAAHINKTPRSQLPSYAEGLLPGRFNAPGYTPVALPQSAQL